MLSYKCIITFIFNEIQTCFFPNEINNMIILQTRHKEIHDPLILKTKLVTYSFPEAYAFPKADATP